MNFPIDFDPKSSGVSREVWKSEKPKVVITDEMVREYCGVFWSALSESEDKALYEVPFDLKVAIRAVLEAALRGRS